MATNSVSALVISKDKVLLVKHSYGSKVPNGTYGLPSGQLKEGESDKEILVRTLKSETGLIVAEEDFKEFAGNDFKANISLKDRSVRAFAMKVFLAKKFTGELVEADDTFPEWVDITSLEQYNLLPNVIEAVRQGLTQNEA